MQHLRNTSMKKSNCSKNENIMSQHQNTQFISLVPKIEGQSKKTLLTEKHIIPTMSNIKCNPCQECEDIVNYESFLKELQCNDKHLHLSECSSQISKTCSLKQVNAYYFSYLNQITKLYNLMSEVNVVNKLVQSSHLTYPNTYISIKLQIIIQSNILEFHKKSINKNLLKLFKFF